MNKNVDKLQKLGKIPDNAQMTDKQFNEYDRLISGIEGPVDWEDAEVLIQLFSNNCDDLNWGLLHIIENVFDNNIEHYKLLIKKCNNSEFRKILETRLNNWSSK